MLKLMHKKIIAILRLKVLFNWTYDTTSGGDITTTYVLARTLDNSV